MQIEKCYTSNFKIVQLISNLFFCKAIYLYIVGKIRTGQLRSFVEPKSKKGKIMQPISERLPPRWSARDTEGGMFPGSRRRSATGLRELAIESQVTVT